MMDSFNPRTRQLQIQNLQSNSQTGNISEADLLPTPTIPAVPISPKKDSDPVLPCARINVDQLDDSEARFQS